jgi:LPS export ABC transporter protein LptC
MNRVVLLCVAAATALGACKGGKEPPVAAKAPSIADSAEQVMFGARTILTSRGVRSAELLSDTAFFYEDGTRVELRRVNTTFFTKTGTRDAVMTSRSGNYNTRLLRMEARGDVVIVSEDGRRLTTPQLRYDQGANQISSDSAFVLTEPGRRLEGVGFVSDPNLTNVRILSGARGMGSVMVPRQ